MAYPYKGVTVDANGNIVPSAAIEVRNRAGVLATIYNASGGALTNPFASDAAGEFEFYAGSGVYFVKSGTSPSDFNETVVLGAGDDFSDPSVMLADTSMRYAPSADYQAPVVAGDVISAGGYRYEVAATAAVDAQETTAGGVKLYEISPTFTTFERFQDSIDRGDAYAIGQTVIAGGPTYIKRADAWVKITPNTNDAINQAIKTSSGLGTTYIQANFEWFVDSINGSDANDGRTADTAFATLSALPTPYPFMRVALAAGSEWREALDWADYDDVIIAGYGDLRGLGLPIVRGDEVLPNSGWNSSVDRADAHTSVYSRTISFGGLDAGTSIYALQWEDDARLVWVDDLATCQSTAGTWYSPELTSSAFTDDDYDLYIHPFGSTNPNSDGKTYEYIDRSYAIRVNDRCTVSYVHGMRAGHNSGAFEGGFDVIFDHLFAEECLRHCALAASGLMRYCVGWMQMDDTRTGHIVLEFYDLTVPDGVKCVWDHCIAVVDGKILGKSYGSGFSGHTSGSTEYSHWQVIDCALKNCAVNSGDVPFVDVIRLRMDNAEVSSGPDTYVSIIDPYATVTGDGMNDAIGSVFTAGSSAAGLYLEGARVYVDGDLAGLNNPVVRRLSGNTYPVTIKRSVVKFTAEIDTLGSEAKVLQFDSSGDVNLVGNIFDIADSPTWARFLREGGSAGTKNTIAAQNNVYYAGSQNFRFSNGADNVSATDWLTAEQPSNETDSVIADPLLRQPASGDFGAMATGLPANCGLERPYLSYTPIPETSADALVWILSN